MKNLYEPLKIDTDTFFWSDLHLGHKCEHWENPLWRSRGFNSVEEHDCVLVDRWNSIITNNSTVFHLGDIMFGQKGEQRLSNLLNILNYKTLYLMFGNHHAGIKQVYNESLNDGGNFNFLPFNNKIVYFTPNYLELYIENQPIVLSHYPIASWNGQSRGSWMIHGHCHGNLKESELGKLLYRGKILDIGVENCKYPISYNDLKHYFSSKSNNTYDHHDSKTLNPF